MPAVSGDFVVALPAYALFVSRLPDVQLGPPRVTAARRFKRHRADRVAVGRKPVGIGQEEFASRLELHHCRMERPAEPSKDVVAPLGRFPLDRIAAKRPWHAHRTLRQPPGCEGFGSKKASSTFVGGATMTRSVVNSSNSHLRRSQGRTVSVRDTLSLCPFHCALIIGR
jgi:hypothetical protein